MIWENWAYGVSDYVNNHPWLVHNQAKGNDDYEPYIAVIIGINGPQGKTTLKNILKHNAHWSDVIELNRDNKDWGEKLKSILNKRKRNIYVFDFGERTFTKDEINEFNNNERLHK